MGIFRWFVVLGLQIPVLASADPKIELTVFASQSAPFYGSAVLVERTPGMLKALVDTLTEKTSAKLLVQSRDETATMVCETSEVVTTCRFKFVHHFPDTIISVGRGYFANKKIQDFSGLQVLTNNPGLEMPFDVVGEKGQRFRLYLGKGRFESVATAGK